MRKTFPILSSENSLLIFVLTLLLPSLLLICFLCSLFKLLEDVCMFHIYTMIHGIFYSRAKSIETKIFNILPSICVHKCKSVQLLEFAEHAVGSLVLCEFII